MKHFVHNEVFSIRKLKVGLCPVLVAVSFLGVQSVFADEVVTSAPQISMNELYTSTTNSIEGSSTSNHDNPTGIDSSTSQLTDSKVDSPLISNKEYKEDGVNTGSFEDEMKDSPLVSNSALSNSTIKSLEGSLTSNHDSLTDFITTYSKSVSSENEVADTSNRNEVGDSNTALEKGTEISALSVKDYGAVGDGVNDDRQAIQDTIDAAAKGLGGGKVYFPEGTYLVKEIVFLRSHTHLEVHEKATILNGINIKNHPSIVFMTGLFTDDGAQVEWAPTEDISYSGGTIDMNGALNEEGTKAKNLPLINSSGAFAIGNSNNVTIKNVTFKDSYQGHAIQIAGSKNVLVDNSRFLGQALPKTMKDGQIISKESIQIEPLTRKGFPYALNDDGKKSENVTIQNSYFGKSEKSGELVTAIGTHYQTATTENPSNIKILNNHFDNMMYAGVRFTGFTDILIKGNRFDKKTKEESEHYRENGAALVNAYSYKNVKDVLDLNKHVTITENVFNIADAKTKAIRVAKDSADYLGKVTDITVTKNIIHNNSQNTEQPNIELLRVSNNLVVSDNIISGGKDGIVIEESAGTITVLNNQLSNLTGNHVSLLKTDFNGTSSDTNNSVGDFNIITENESYKIFSQNSGNHSDNHSDKHVEEIKPVAENKNNLANNYSVNSVDDKIEKSNHDSGNVVTGEISQKQYDVTNVSEVVKTKNNQHALPKTGLNKMVELLLTIIGICLLFGQWSLKRRYEDR
ncbi:MULTISPECIES: glycosyl hydrolase family 28-related protein [Streptococcus]|jgi:plasmin and fibronectin-binding protein A|uniref:Plasmin and fibronectin-binding protein A n=1 Tax=Streptococcus mitis bv. 2 str. F0392 TaxID=768726 RepID=F9P309_STROR|nr:MULTISPECIES: glycosyl hydrolase family 28-related protein [Streptococcus]EGR93280.1 plasmin and fibronectin-binding protein A [Streptococcus mitis bv. 2 str. F0392]RSJ02613.1 Plasmin and fibronectin-binding protein A precursor [Streptococcus mitis]